MPIPSRATLKSYFETADQPTQAQFAAWIDAMFDLNQQALDLATASAATSPNCVVRGLIEMDYVAGVGAACTWTAYRNQLCTVAVTPALSTPFNFNLDLTITPATNFTDANFAVLGLAVTFSRITGIGVSTFTPSVIRAIGSLTLRFAVVNTTIYDNAKYRAEVNLAAYK